MGVDVVRNISFGCVSDKSEWSRSSAHTTPTPVSVKRSLFGAVDHEESMSFLQKELNKIVEEKTAQYNFDFVKDVPLKGTSYKWEKVDNVRSTTCKTRSKVTKSRNGKRSPLKNRVVNRDNLETNNRSKQSSITDFLDKVKRTNK